MEHEKEIERLAELLWRTFKLRVSLLLFAIVVLVIARSALADGDLRAQDVDIKFCQQLLGDTALKPELTCTAKSARTFDEGSRWANQILAPALSGDPSDTKLRDLYQKKQAAIEAYDGKRAAAYQIQIQLSSEFPSSTVTLNVLSVARFGLFCALILLFLVALWGYQQSSYRAAILELVGEKREGHDVRLALSQYFSGLSPPRRKGLLKYLVVSPDLVAMAVLWIAVGLLFLAVFLSFAGKLAHLDDSVFFSYPFALYAVAYGLCYILLINRESYRLTVGGQVKQRTHRETVIERWRWLTPALAAVGFLSLLLPWISTPNDYIWGYRLLLKQKPLNEFGQYRMYPIDPQLFRELKIQLILALVFLLVCALNGVISYLVKTGAPTILRVGQKLLAHLFLFLSLNLLFYMGVLEYETETGAQLVGIGIFLRDLSVYERGFSLAMYNPAYGFLIFLVCSFPLVWISLRVSKRKSP